MVPMFIGANHALGFAPSSIKSCIQLGKANKFTNKIKQVCMVFISIYLSTLVELNNNANYRHNPAGKV
jgi:hypothetical protein